MSSGNATLARSLLQSRCRIPRTASSRVFCRRRLTVLAIETSCDDTSVAIVKVADNEHDTRDATLPRPPRRLDALEVIFHEKETANSESFAGIHPLVALHSHRSNLALLVQKATARLVTVSKQVTSSQYRTRDSPNLVAVTRGPGMRSNLSVGLDTAKGLAVAWNCQFIGVHHMQAHALTPRLVSAMANGDGESDRITSGAPQPNFPFLTVLASGGHTMLVDSTGLTEHAILAETQDIALGNFLDQAARAILPPELLLPPYGRALAKFAFHTHIRTEVHDHDDELELDRGDKSVQCSQSNDPAYHYTAPARRQEELERRTTKWGWSLGPPLAESKGGQSSRRMIYSFAGLLSSVERFLKFKTASDGSHTAEPRLPADVSLAERQDMAREVQRVAFEHLASRIMLHLESVGQRWTGDTIVVSGGVASNQFLRHVLRSMLDARGYSHIQLSCPPVGLCTDNALMIAWAGIEMYRAGYTSSLAIGPIRKWSMDPSNPDGGLLGVDGWMKREME